MEVKHKHLIIRCNVNNPFTDVEKTKDWLCRLVNAINMKICKSGGPHVDYVESEGNNGIAGIVMIETSHISIHCWDKQQPSLAQLDVYSCAEFDPQVVFNYVAEMQPTSMDCMLLDRSKEIDLQFYTPWRY